MEIDILAILEIIGYVVMAATVVARLTKTKKDDSYVQKVRKIVEFISNLGLPDRLEIPTKKKK